MATREANIEQTYYIIARFESNWTYGAVNYNDPITMGIIQNYAYNCARLLRKLRESDPNWGAFAQAAPRIAGYLDTLNDAQWPSVFVTQTEGNAFTEMAQSAENHAIQDADARELFNNYMNTLINKGLSDDDPKKLVYACVMYHQNPANCFKVLNACGNRATLEYMNQCCLNNSVFSVYPSRYEGAYEMLQEWDGESMPPDFGQSGDYSFSGQATGVNAGGGSASISVKRVSVSQGRMMIYGTGYENGIQCRQTSPGNWIPERRNVTGGSDVDPEWIGGGSGGVNDVCDLYDFWEKNYDFEYSQGDGRMNLPDSGASDCSASIWCAYNIAAGINVGTWTGDQMTKGEEIAIGWRDEFTQEVFDLLQPGDLIIFAHNGMVSSGNSDHVEMFMGSDYTNNLLGGGSAPVPHYKDCWDYVHMQTWDSWCIRRYL